MSIPEVAPHPYAALHPVERARLLDLLGTLSADDWSRPTPCPGWSVLGLCHHLIGGDLGLLARRRDRHFGTVPPDGVDEAGFIGWLDRLQDEWVQATRRISPPCRRRSAGAAPSTDHGHARRGGSVAPHRRGLVGTRAIIGAARR